MGGVDKLVVECVERHSKIVIRRRQLTDWQRGLQIRFSTSVTCWAGLLALKPPLPSSSHPSSIAKTYGSQSATRICMFHFGLIKH